jgi:hypothetical protein
VTQRDTFPVIYARLAEKVTDEAVRRGVRRPPLRDLSVADVSLLDVPRSALLSIPDDEDFVSSSYLVLVDTAPSPWHTAHVLRRLRSGELSRTGLWDELMASAAFVDGNRRVNFT